MSFHSLKESFEEVPTKATDALDAQVDYYKLFLFRFIAQSSTGLITFFIVAFACLLMLFFVSIAAAYAVGEAVDSIAWGFVIVGAFYIVVAAGAFFFRKVLIVKPLLRKLSEIYFKAAPDDDEE